MKGLKSISIIFVVLVLQSCYEPGTIQVQNNISNVRITDVKWGSAYISTELLPGETSEKRTIDRYLEELPKSYKLSFKMTANNRSIFLETEEEYLLEEEDELLIILTDETNVVNPNE